MSLTNLQIADLLARAASEYTEQKAKACRKAARACLSWPEEAATIDASDRSLTELDRVGPWLARLIAEWLESPPEEIEEQAPLRSGFSTVAAARSIIESTPLAERIRGDLQMHTTYSDGGGTLDEMAIAATARGYEYIAITDHSKGLKIAGGIDEETLAEQGREIEALNEKLDEAGTGLQVLRSIELNLSPDGSGDMSPDSLDNLDIVLGSFHSKLRIKEDQTERYIAALSNPHLNVLGHPQGRIYNFRAGLVADWEKVFAEAYRRDVAIEIDCYPDRQDLRPDLRPLAAASGVRVSLGTDSHAPWQLPHIALGVAGVIDSGIAEDRVLNLMPAAELKEWAGLRRKRNG